MRCKKTALLNLALFFCVLLSGLLPLQKASAHPAGWAPFFSINGHFANQYFVLSNQWAIQPPNNIIDVPQSESVDSYKVNQSIDFAIDFRLLTVPQELGRVDFTIDTGDGHKYQDTHIQHAYSKPGSYIVKVNVDIPVQNAKGTIEAVKINILPYEGYKLPKAVISLEGKSTSVNVPFNYDSNQPLHFDAHDSTPGSSRIVSYKWDFDDNNVSSNDIAAIHTYDPQYDGSIALLRVSDQAGFFSDTYVLVKNRQPGNASYHPSMSFTKRYNKLYLDMSVWLRNTIARLGGIGEPIPKIFFVLVLLIAVVLGALHALTPGHSKSLMAALLVGKKNSKSKDVFILASAITFTHTIVIFLLGFVFLVLDTKLTLNKVLPAIEKISAAVVLILGISLIYRGLKAIWAHHRHKRAHENDEEHHHGHSHDAKNADAANSSWGLFLAGASGGIIPCIDALSLLVLAASVHAVWFGLLIVLFFSFGLAASIVLIGLTVIRTKKFLKIEERLGEKVNMIAPLVTGTFIIILGIALFMGKFL